MASRLLLCLLLPAACLALRAEPEGVDEDLRSVSGISGIPKLEVLYTSSGAKAASFIERWSGARDFGLYLHCMRDGHRPAGRVSVVFVGISHGSRVLVFDLRPFVRTRLLPPQIAAFLESEDHTFFGMGLIDTAALLATDLKVVARCVDYGVRAWRMDLSGGLASAAERYLGVRSESLPALSRLSGQAVHAHLEWAIADHFTRLRGEMRPEWVLTLAELFGARAAHRLPSSSARAAVDWGAAHSERLRRHQELAVTRFRQRWRSFARDGARHRVPRAVAVAELSWRPSRSRSSRFASAAEAGLDDVLRAKAAESAAKESATLATEKPMAGRARGPAADAIEA